MPAFVAAEDDADLRRCSARSARAASGAIALIPICTAERLVDESVPAARISQR